MVMEDVGFFYLLLCAGFLLASSEVLHVKRREGNVAVLPCGKLRKGNVIWSREINGQKVKILKNNNGQVTRYSAGSDRRYGSGGNLCLTIFRVSQSDAGRYYCNGATVKLTIIRTEVLHVKTREGNFAVLHCGNLHKGKVTWSREINGQKVDILNNNNGQVTRYSAGSDGRYGSGGNLWLIIFKVLQSDAGRYYCNGETVELTVTRTEVLHVEGREGNVAVLHCGKLRKGSVTWSREINGQRVDILNNNNGQVTRYSAGSDGRYGSGGNLWLTIFRVSQSDAGRYYCNGETVELTVTRTGESTAEECLPDVLKVVVLIVSGSCLVVKVSALLLSCYFSRKKY